MVTRRKWKVRKELGSEYIGEAYRKRMVVRRLCQYRSRMVAIRDYDRRHCHTYLMALDAWRHIRAVENDHSIAQAFWKWRETVWMESALDTAQHHYRHQLLGRVMGAMKKYALWRREIKRQWEHRKDVLRHLEEEMERARAALEEERRRKEEEEKRREEEVSVAC